MAVSSNKNILRYLKVMFSPDPSIPETEIADFLPAIIYIAEPAKKRFRFVNQKRISDFLGYSEEEIASWENDLKQVVFEEDLETVNQELEKFYLLEDEVDHTFEARLTHKEGNWRYFRTKGTVLQRDNLGKPEVFLFMAEDVTEQNQSAEEVAALKKLVDDTESLIEFGSWSWDLKSDKVYWTDGMYNLLDYNKEELQEEITNDFFLTHLSHSDAVTLMHTIQSAVNNQTDFEFKYTVTTYRNEEKRVCTKGKTIAGRNGEVIKVIGITRDITEQTKLNADLVHYQQLMLEKEEFLKQGSWETALATDKTIFTKGLYHLFGYEREEDINKVDVNSLLPFLTGEGETEKSKGAWKATLQEKEHYTYEATIITNNGERKHLETYGKIIKNKDKNIPEKIIGTTRDVTKLREYEKSLEENIRELNRSNTELEEFAYIASHDLQEPLRKLTTFSERLQLKFTEKLGPDGVLYLNRIVAATENMRILIENLLEFSRTARSNQYFSKANLSDLLQEVKADLELKIEETGTIIVDTPLPTMEIIPTQIKQLFDNLLSNSIKFKKDTELPVIHVSCNQLDSEEKRKFNLRPDKTYFNIKIQDNGIGFEQEYAERIFQIFQRLHGKSQYPGSGIGLAICKKIVENHNGLIFADGSTANGAIFTVILPETQS